MKGWQLLRASIQIQVDSCSQCSFSWSEPNLKFFSGSRPQISACFWSLFGLYWPLFGLYFYKKRTKVPCYHPFYPCKTALECGLLYLTKSYKRPRHEFESRNPLHVGMDCIPFKIPSRMAGDFSYRFVIPPLRKKSRSARLFGCKCPHHGSLSLPTFCRFAPCGTGDSFCLALTFKILDRMAEDFSYLYLNTLYQ